MDTYHYVLKSLGFIYRDLVQMVYVTAVMVQF